MDERLIAAAAAGDVAGIRAALADGADVDARDADGRTAVLTATVAGQTAAVEALIDAEANVDLQDDRLDNPFLYAGAEGLLDILRLVNEAGADPALTNRYGGTALHPGHRARPRRGRPLPADRVRRRHRPRQPARLDGPARGDRPVRRRAAPTRRSSSCSSSTARTSTSPTRTGSGRWPTPGPAARPRSPPR